MENKKNKNKEPLDHFSDWMKKDWNERAAEDACYYIHSAKRNQTEEEFDTSGKESVDSLIVSDLTVITGGKEPSALKVLEIGCGTGRMTKHMAALFGADHGIDVSSEMIRLGKERLKDYKNVFLYETNGKDLALLPDRMFDFIFSFIVFQHIPSKEVILNYIAEAYRVLKEDGIFKFQVQGYTDPGWMAAPKDTWHGVTYIG